MNKTLEKIATAAAVGMVLIPIVALAANANAATVSRVQVGDRDLSRPAHVAVFDARVRAAAKPLCATYTVDSRIPNTNTNACSSAVRDEAVAKLGAAQKVALQSAQGAR